MTPADDRTIATAVHLLAQAAPQAEQILLFGSQALGTANEGSDLDFLVIQSQVDNRAQEMVRLRRALRLLPVPVDVLVYSRAEVERWRHESGSALYWALKEGIVLHDTRPT